jgi:hypothetical protein
VHHGYFTFIQLPRSLKKGERLGLEFPSFREGLLKMKNQGNSSLLELKINSNDNRHT